MYPDVRTGSGGRILVPTSKLKKNLEVPPMRCLLMGTGVIRDSSEERTQELLLLSLFEIEDVERVTLVVVMVVPFLGDNELCNRADLLCDRVCSTSVANILFSSFRSVHLDVSILDAFKVFMMMLSKTFGGSILINCRHIAEWYIS